MANLSLIWPSEEYLPNSLFKHFAYLGEVAGYLRRFSDVRVLDLSVEQKKRSEIIKLMEESDFIGIPLEVYNIKNGVNLAKLAKQSSNAFVAAYGTVASINPEVISPYFDVVLQRDSWEKQLTFPIS